MLQSSGWSVWEIVAVGAVAWTGVSFLFAMALASVLRANRMFHADASAEEIQRPELIPDAPSAQFSQASSTQTSIPAAAIAASATTSGFALIARRAEPSLLDQLMPAELEEQEDSATRSSGTRFRPVHDQDAAEERDVQPLRRVR